MSFKDVRDLSEHLKHLGCPNNFPISVLHSPYGSPASFKIVADILQWLAGRLEPDTILPGGTFDEAERVLLIRSAAEFFVTKAAIKLNPRRLYASTAGAAAELLKITSLLMNAPTDVERDDESYTNSTVVDLGDKIDDLKRARELSSELTNKGASLYDLLAKELVNKETRNIQASRLLELSNVEKYLKNAISSITQKLHTSKIQLETSKTEKNALASKLERKSADLDRLKQRLEALHKIRPAFLEEFERLEIELKGLYEQYFIRVRCLDALRMQVATRAKSTPQTMISVTRPTDSSINYLPDGLIDSDEDVDGISGNGNDDDDLKLKTEKRETLDDSIEPRAATRLRVRTAVTRNDRPFVGNMMGSGAGSDLDSSLGTDDSDSEIDLPDDLRSDDDDTIAKLTGDVPTKTSKLDQSDEDF